MAEKGYAGKVKNTGSQYVQAPFAQSKKSRGVVKRGEDLRDGVEKTKGKK